jgi:DNA polymerase III psi subunit
MKLYFGIECLARHQRVLDVSNFFIDGSNPLFSRVLRTLKVIDPFRHLNFEKHSVYLVTQTLYSCL